MLRPVRRHGRGRRGSADGTAGATRQRRRHRPAVPRRHVRPHHLLRGHGAHPRRRRAPSAELARVLKPGGMLAVTVPAWLPEKICWALTDEYHAPFVAGGHVRIFTEAELRETASRDAGLVPGRLAPRPRAALALLVAEVRGRPHQRRPPAGAGLPPAAGVGHREGARKLTRWTEKAAQPGARQEPGVYATQAGQGRRSAVGSADITVPRGRRRASPPPRSQATVDAIAEWQLPNGMVPWFPGGHADPWNHVEAAMALALGGRIAEAERAYDWLVGLQRPDGAWHQYYLEDGVEQDKLDANVVRLRRRRRVAPLAAHRRPRLRRDDVAGGRAGHRLRARPADAPRRDPLGPPRRRHAVVVRPAHRVVEHLPQPALRHRARRALGHERPDWELVRRPAGRTSSATSEADAFAPKHRWAMDWYYPVLGGVLAGDAAASAWPTASTRSSMDGRGVRCVQRPAVGHRRRDLRVPARPPRRRRARHGRAAVQLGAAVPRSTTAATGPAPSTPTWSTSPADEQSTYTAAAVVLAADALAAPGPAAGVVHRPRRGPARRPDRHRRPTTPASTTSPTTAPCGRADGRRVRPVRSSGARAASPTALGVSVNAADSSARQVDLVGRAAAVGGVREHVVDGRAAAGRDVRRPALVVAVGGLGAVAAVDEQERQRRRPVAADRGRVAHERDDRALQAGVEDRAAERAAACPCGRSRDRPGRARGAPSPAWFSSDPRWWSRANSTVPRGLRPRRPGRPTTCRSSCRSRATGRPGTAAAASMAASQSAVALVGGHEAPGGDGGLVQLGGHGGNSGGHRRDTTGPLPSSRMPG